MIELHPSTTRNRHTVANDIKTALIKRINRQMRPQDWNLKAGKNGKLSIVEISTGKIVIEKMALTLDELAAIWKVQNATACVDVTLPNVTFGTITSGLAPSYSSHY